MKANGKDDIPYIMENKSHAPVTTNQMVDMTAHIIIRNHAGLTFKKITSNLERNFSDTSIINLARPSVYLSSFYQTMAKIGQVNGSSCLHRELHDGVLSHQLVHPKPHEVQAQRTKLLSPRVTDPAKAMGNKPRGARGGLIHKAFCWFLRRSWPNHSLPPAMRQWQSPGPTSVAAPAGALDALSRTSSPEAQSVEGVPPFQASWIFVHRSSKRVKRSDLVLSSGKSPAATINSVGIKNPLGKASDVQYIASPLKKNAWK